MWLSALSGAAAPAHVVGYDQASGFGLVQALGRLGVPPLELGSADASGVGDPVIIAGEGGLPHALKAAVVSKREFAGYWEYVLDEAIFTAPAHPQWGGAALIGADGRLAAIGSLLVQEKIDAGTIQGNMLVPIDLWTRRSSPARPTRAGAAPPASAPTAGSRASARCSCRRRAARASRPRAT